MLNAVLPNVVRISGLALLIVGMILIEGGSAEASSDQTPVRAGVHVRPD